jgi:outer membrane protein assembly factor BamA
VHRWRATAFVAIALALVPARAVAAPGDDPYDDGTPAAPATPAPSTPAPAPPSAPSPAPPKPPDAPAKPAETAAPLDEHAGALADASGKARVRYTLEGIEIRGNQRTAARVLLRYVRFRAGDVLDVDDPELELTRYRLLGTGFFASVDLSLRKGARRGAARLVIDVVERNTLVLQNLALGIAADQDTAGSSKPLSAFVGIEAAETNLAGTGITLGAGVGLAADQLALRARFADPALAGTGWSASATLLYNDALDFFGNRGVAFESPSLVQREVTDYAVVSYRRFGGTLSTGHDLTLATQFQLEYHLEQIDATVPTIASHIRGDTREPIQFDILPGKSVLSSLRAGLLHDTRDAPFLTTRGTLASASVTLGLPPLGSSYGFQKIELALRHWFRLPWSHVVRLGAYGGGIAGDAPFFEKFYVGDFTDLLPDRVLDLAPDRRPPPNLLRTDIAEVRYGDFAAKIDAEYRIPVYTGRGAVYGVDVFATAGLYGVATRRELTEPPSGYSGARKIPVDLTYNLGVRVDTKVGGITLAFSNLLGLLPARQGAHP